MTFTFFCKDNELELDRDIYILILNSSRLFSYYNHAPNWTYRDGSRFPYEYFKRR